MTRPCGVWAWAHRHACLQYICPGTGNLFWAQRAWPGERGGEGGGQGKGEGRGAGQGRGAGGRAGGLGGRGGWPGARDLVVAIFSAESETGRPCPAGGGGQVTHNPVRAPCFGLLGSAVSNADVQNTMGPTARGLPVGSAWHSVACIN